MAEYIPTPQLVHMAWAGPEKKPGEQDKQLDAPLQGW
jgi:hypothetical protein